jgi:hypothetical protein
VLPSFTLAFFVSLLVFSSLRKEEEEEGEEMKGEKGKMDA